MVQMISSKIKLESKIKEGWFALKMKTMKTLRNGLEWNENQNNKHEIWIRPIFDEWIKNIHLNQTVERQQES